LAPKVGDKTIRARIENKSGEEEWVGFACYEAPNGVDDLLAQILHIGWNEYPPIILQPGGKQVFTILLPECVWQCDLFIGRKRPKTPPVYTADELVQHADSERLGLELPQICEPPPPPNGCEVEWTELKPEVTYGEWGECIESVGAQQSCSQSRSVRTVIKEKNSCTEEIRVKSDETTEESKPCDCPCELTCEFGYELNEARCKCEPLPLCHVSNKGGDGDWNIQESQKKFSPGHEGHLDKSKFCPPDYFGTCSGKWDNTPNMCDSPN
jgi:hypothetical protein